MDDTSLFDRRVPNLFHKKAPEHLMYELDLSLIDNYESDNYESDPKTKVSLDESYFTYTLLKNMISQCHSRSLTDEYLSNLINDFGSKLTFNSDSSLTNESKDIQPDSSLSLEPEAAEALENNSVDCALANNYDVMKTAQGLRIRFENTFLLLKSDHLDRVETEKAAKLPHKSLRDLKKKALRILKNSI